MKKFDILGYIRKFQLLIIIVCILAGILSYFALNSRQSYTASAIIRYANNDAAAGYAPDGTEIDTSEIYSSNVISDVFSKLGLSYSSYNVDDMRSGVSVEALKTDEQTAIDEAIIEKGEEITEVPVEYKIKYTVLNGTVPGKEDDEFSRQFLDELLDSYISYYAEEHISMSTPAVNDISKIDSGNYDYIEKAEILKDSITNACDQLQRRSQGAGTEFRSAATGYNFTDLQREFSILRDIDVWDLYTYILDNHITSAKDVLVAKYQNRINEYKLTNDNSQQQIDYVEGVIDAYVKMMRESGNTDITYEYILDNIDSVWYTNEQGDVYDADQTVEYDTLLGSYAGLKNSYDENLVEVAYCQYILDLYSAADESGNNDDTRYKAQKMIDSIVEKANNLFDIMAETNEEYNEYIGAQNIVLLSGISVGANIPIVPYVIIIVAVFGVLGCLGAIVIGRLVDIFEYYAYDNHKFNIPNRAACDRELAKYDKISLNNDFVAMSFRINNLTEKNKIYGVEAVDGMILQLIKIIQNVLSGERDCFIGLNSADQLLVFAKSMTDERAEAYCEQIIKAADAYNVQADCRLADCTLAFTIGIAEAGKEGIYQIKDLMLRAMKNSDYCVQDEDNAAEEYSDYSAEASAVLGKAEAESRTTDEVIVNNDKAENTFEAVDNTETEIISDSAVYNETNTEPVPARDTNNENYTESISKQLEELKKALKA